LEVNELEFNEVTPAALSGVAEFGIFCTNCIGEVTVG
jgi:hypothetical protein